MMLRKQPKKPRRSARLRCPAHLAWVRRTYLCVAGNKVNWWCEGQIQAAHWRLGAHAGTGQKPNDDRVLPLCERHHAEAHRIGEDTFAKRYNLDIPSILAELQRLSEPLRRLRMKMRKTA